MRGDRQRGHASWRCRCICIARDLAYHEPEHLQRWLSREGISFRRRRPRRGTAERRGKNRRCLLNITEDSVPRICQVPDDILSARVNQHVATVRPHEDIEGEIREGEQAAETFSAACQVGILSGGWGTERDRHAGWCAATRRATNVSGMVVVGPAVLMGTCAGEVLVPRRAIAGGGGRTQPFGINRTSCARI